MIRNYYSPDDDDKNIQTQRSLFSALNQCGHTPFSCSDCVCESVIGLSHPVQVAKQIVQ